MTLAGNPTALFRFKNNYNKLSHPYYSKETDVGNDE